MTVASFSAFDWCKYATPDLAIAERFALIYLKHHTFNKRHVAYVSVKTMMEALGTSRRYLFLILEKLKHLQYITAVGKTAQGVIEYFVNWPKTIEKSYPQGVKDIAPLGFSPGEGYCTGGVKDIAPLGVNHIAPELKEVKYELKEEIKISKTQTLKATSKTVIQQGGGSPSYGAQKKLLEMATRLGISPEIGETEQGI